MSNVFSIKEAETICNAQEIPEKVYWTDERGNTRPLVVTSFNLFVNQKREHNKFYEMYQAIDVDKYLFYIIVKYGRIGNKEIERSFVFAIRDKCDRFCQAKKLEKLNKGYEEITFFEDYKRKAGGFHNE